MAIGHVTTASGGNTKTASTPVSTPNVNANVGDVVVVIAGANDIASAEALSSTAVTDSASNTWVRLLTQQNTDATAANHAAGAIYATKVTNAMVNATITVTPHATSVAKGFVYMVLTGATTTLRGVNQGQVTASTPAAMSSSAPLAGDIVIAATVLEGPTSDTWTADADTTLGSWSANTTGGTSGGTATDNIAVRTQHKIVNANGTQTYNGINSVSRDMQRMLVVLTPDPPPASAPAPPLYRPSNGIQFSVGLSRIVSGQVDAYALGPNFDRRLPPIIYNSGVASPAEDITGVYLPSVQPIVHAFIDLGFAVVSPTTLYTYGNATSQAAITAAAAWARTNLGCSSLPFPIFGGSEGACDSLTYAFTNPTLVACVVGVIPVIDLAEMVEQNVLGLATTILSAWGVGALPLPAGADPNTAGHRATLAAQVPMQLWYATDDAVSANITAFATATGADLRAVGPYGHTNEAIARSHPLDIARFIRSRVGVRHSSRVF